MTDAATGRPLDWRLPLTPPAWLEAVIARPAQAFIVASLLFGAACVAINPPLRGPDETAHFVRAWAIGQGVPVPVKAVDGRMGIAMPAPLHDAFTVFRHAEHRFAAAPFDYREVFGELRALRAGTDGDLRLAIFVPYEGSEAYTPVAYLPHALGARIGHALGLDFVPLNHLMRAVGLLLMTLVVAYAIAVAPVLKWAFFLIGMLPMALYGRAVIGADAATLAFTLVAAALCLRAAVGVREYGGALARGLWLTLTMLTKPSQVALALLEAMNTPPGAPRRRWLTALLVTLPGLGLASFWVLATSGEMASWRVVEGTGRPAEEFDPLWKLGFMLEQPLYFPRLLLVTLVDQFGALWLQLFGVFGRLDAPLRPWVYPLLSGLLAVSAVRRLPVPRSRRWWLAGVNLSVITAYAVFVYLIMFLTWTSLRETVIWGVQGRYFIVVLPSLVIAAAALVDRDVGARTRAAAALAGAALSGLATADALWRAHW